METFSFEIDKELWETEVFPKVKIIFLKGGETAFLDIKQTFFDLINLTRQYYDSLVKLKGVAGAFIDKTNIDSKAVNMFLDYLEGQIANLSWEEIIK